MTSRPPMTDIRLHETMPSTGVRKSALTAEGTVAAGSSGSALTDVTHQRNMASNATATIPTASSVGGGKSSLLAPPSFAPSSVGAYSLSQYRHDSLDVKAEVDRMYNNILKSLEGSAVDPHHSHSSGRPQQYGSPSATDPISAHQQCTPLSVNYAMGGGGGGAHTRGSGGGNDYFDFMSANASTPSPYHHNANTSSSMSRASPAAHSYINATTDSRVAAMQALLRHNKHGGSGSTSGLYRNNTFGSGRKGMSEPVPKMDTPGPGSYYKDETLPGGRASSARRGRPDSVNGSLGRAASASGAPRAGSAMRARSADRGVSFGRAERPALVMSDKAVYASKREPAMRPPGPGDYVAPSTFNSTKPSSTKGSFGKADRDAGARKSIAPGPGSYAIAPTKDDKGGAKSAAFASMTPRLPSAKSEAPGPGAYLAADSVGQQGFSFGKAPLATLAAPSEITPGPGDYYIATEDPSKALKGVIPTTGRDDGAWGGKKLAEDTPGPGAYTIKEEERDGVSMKFRYKERVEAVPGPGYYNPDDHSAKTGPAWSLVGKVAERPIEITPGPGQYTDDVVAIDPSRGVSIGGARRETPADIATKENLPGPGFYETASSALNPSGAVAFGNTRREHAFDVDNEIPGPGTYDVDTADGVVDKRAPVPTLGTATERFPEPSAGKATPGPGYYMVNTEVGHTIPGGALDQAVRDGASKWGTNDTATGTLGPGAYDNPVTFNTGRAVSISLPAKERHVESNPDVGPGAYDTVEASAALLPTAPSTTIGKENRFGVPPKPAVVPGPGTYDAVDPETWLYERTPAATFGGAQRMEADAKEDHVTLGPGAYMYEHVDAMGARPAVGGAIDGAARFPSEAAERARLGAVPGPGAYDIPSVGIDTDKAITIGGTGHATMEAKTAGPGPGAYHVGVSTLAENGVSIGNAPQRMLDAKDNMVPGPGAYDVSRTAVDPHVSAPTFNGRPLERPPSAPGVGPGAYDPSDAHLPSAPSVSMANGPRHFDIVSGRDVPGPGYYDPRDEAPHQQGGVGLLASGAPRFVSANPSLTPGPGTYEPERFHEAMESRVGITMGGAAGHDTTLKPSEVPGPGAYDPRHLETNNGITIHAYDKAKAAGPTEDLPGPGTYNLPSTMNTHAPSFGVGTRPELHPAGHDAPGPGMYDPHNAMKLLHQASPAYSFSAAAKYGIPDSRALYPGPGAYFFDRKEQHGPAYSFGHDVRPTLHPVMSDAPGPGLYNVDVRPSAPAYSFPSAARVVDPPSQDVPGPGAYETKVGPSGPFVSIGGAEGHSVYLRGNGAVDVPGPGAYNIGRSGVLAGDENAPAYSFGAAPKLQEAVPADQPGPGHYNPLLYAEGPFYSIAGKYPNNLEPRPDGPGPGAYDVASTLQLQNGVTVPQAIRFPAAHNEEVPGPGSYLAVDGKNDAPSIGFGVAQRMPNDAHSDVPGPGMYDQTLPPQGPWYSIRGKPHDPDHANEAPGPGAYNSELPADARGAVMLGAPRFERDATEDVPGPGMYALGSQWNDGKGVVFPTAERPSDRELREASMKPGPGQYSTALGPQGPFYSILGKYREEANGNEHVPGPGAYNAGALERGPSAFIGNAPRGPADPHDANPGPGAYVLPGALSPLGVTFGVAQRMPNAPESDAPGPGLYDAGGPGMFDGPKYSFPLAANRPPAANDVPGPGMYNAGAGKDATMPQDSVYSFARGNRMPHDKASPDNGPGAYNVGEAPHAGPAWSFGQAGPHGRGSAVADTPGPGSYAPANLWNREGPSIPGKWRDGSGPNVPGPGAYRMHDFDPYARDMATVIDFSKGGERIVNAPIKVVTSAGPGEYYRLDHYIGTKKYRFLERYPDKYVEPTPGPPDYHSPNVENPFYDPLAR